jgi:LmbE family N-acetylglucosaminyl deacetylase
MKLLAIGAHPDDPEDCCGGAVLRARELGHEVTSLYLTRGEAGIAGTAESESAAIRTREALLACEAQGVKPLFFDQIDAKCHVDVDTRNRFAQLVASEQPDVIFTHWPIDTHRDHQVCALLSFEAWFRLKATCDLAYYEAMYGLQSMQFYPTHYVDISNVVARKHAIMRIHASQAKTDWRWVALDPMERFRGKACGVERAEAFIALDANRAGKLTRLGIFR